MLTSCCAVAKQGLSGSFFWVEHTLVLIFVLTNRTDGKQTKPEQLKKVITLLTLLLCAVCSVQAQNQAFSGTQHTELALSNAIDIGFVATGNSNGSDVNLVFSDVNDYANGIESSPIRLKVRSNKKFIVRAKTSSKNFSYSGTTSPAPTMPVKNTLYIKVFNNNTGGNVPNAVNNQYKTLKKGNRKIINNGQAGGEQTFDVQYKATPGFAYPAGTYSVNVIYTATQK